MAIAKLGQAAFTPWNSGTSTNGPVDTSGATLIVIGLSRYRAGGTLVFTDSKGNTWTPLTAYVAANETQVQLFYAENPTVGTGHTFTGTNTGAPSYATAFVAWFDGTATTSVFDAENGATSGSTATSLQPGSVTPAANGSLVITELAAQGISNTYAINSSFTVIDQNPNVGNGEGGALAYLIQTTAAAVNPTWSWGSAVNDASAAIAVFKAAAASAPTITGPSGKQMTGGFLDLSGGTN